METDKLTVSQAPTAQYAIGWNACIEFLIKRGASAFLHKTHNYDVIDAAEKDATYAYTDAYTRPLYAINE